MLCNDDCAKFTACADGVGSVLIVSDDFQRNVGVVGSEDPIELLDQIRKMVLSGESLNEHFGQDAKDVCKKLGEMGQILESSLVD